MSRRWGRAGLHAGWLAGLLFVVALLAFSALAPGMLGHGMASAYQPVSVLGLRGAPWASGWNAFGFVLPGLLVAAFALALQRPLARDGAGSVARIGVWLLLISGLGFAGSGVFAFDPQRPDADASKLHVAMLAIALLGFLPATACLAIGLRRLRGWSPLVWPGLLLLLATIASLSPRLSGLVPVLQGRPGYAQRATLGLYFAWLALAALTALRRDRS